MIFGRKAEAPIGDAEVVEFRAICETIAKHLAKAGKKNPALSAGGESLRTASQPRAILAIARDYAELLQSACDAGDSLDDSKALTWRMLRKLGCTPQSDIFGKIDDEDVIEIYNLDHVQIFRNLNFFDYCSMTVEDMLTLVWSRDTKRESKFSLKIIMLAVRLKTGLLNRTVSCLDVPEHLVTELKGARNRFHVQLKYFSPLRRDGRIVGGLVTNRARLI